MNTKNVSPVLKNHDCQMFRIDSLLGPMKIRLVVIAEALLRKQSTRISSSISIVGSYHEPFSIGKESEDRVE